MRLSVWRHGISIFPENETDVAFIEDTLGVKACGSSVKLVRVNVLGTGQLAYLEAKAPMLREAEPA